MQVIHHALEHAGTPHRVVPLRVERRTLAKTRWRASAEDGREFGFALEQPLQHGAPIWSEDGVAYRIEQLPEPVLEIALPSAAAAAAAQGWQLGNLHQSIQILPGRIRLADEPGVRRALEALGLRVEARVDVFQPQRTVGATHAHGHGHHE